MTSTGLGLADATRAVLRDVHGKFSIGVVHVDEPDLIVGARRGSPLICGLNATTAFLASDIPAIHGQAEEFFVIDDERVVELRPGAVRITTLQGDEVAPERREVTWDLAVAEKGGYPDFMLKEIHEQPDAVRDTLLGRIDNGVVALDDSQLTDDDLRRIDKVFVVGCGTSYNAGLVGELAIEHWAKLPVESDIASEFRYRDPVLSPRQPRGRHQPVGRIARHDGSGQLRQAAGGAGADGLQRGRLVDGAGLRRCDLHPRRS